ncbi:50S ribosomal protein L13, partial [bacterium]|nr:50S ribosomal protein L13 [bacterium]
QVTSKKPEQKMYYRHSGYPGGIKEESFNALKKRKPELIIEKAVWGMLPKNRLGRAIIKKLHVYSTDTHPHESQNPVELSFNIKKVADNE